MHRFDCVSANQPGANVTHLVDSPPVTQTPSRSRATAHFAFDLNFTIEPISSGT
ncbi:MAG: hypothetical protein ACI9SE_002625 [Neolewinella sp.]